LLTQCPNCETTFRVTAEILRVADGQVRCGRCHTQFDALERLLEEGDPTAAESGRFLHNPTEPQREAIEVSEPDATEEITLEGKRIEISGTYRVLDTGSGESQMRRDTTEEWADIEDDAEGETFETSTDGIEVSEAEPESEQFEPEIPQPATIEPEQPIRATRAPFGSRLLREEPAREAPDEFSLLDSGSLQKPAARIWSIIVAPLALLLLAQIVHHHRSELARHPRVGAPLMSVYNALGLRLTPDWNLHAYGVKQWGVVIDPAAPGTLKVRASITNGAAFAQPYPLLKLVLEDRWGDQVRAREFEPSEYLDPGVASDRLLAPSQQTNATISIVDPGPDAEGFRFDVCLPGSAGPVCAADVPAR
jgi:predicted Zn finger-like uncharacterized protein